MVPPPCWAPPPPPPSLAAPRLRGAPLATLVLEQLPLPGALGGRGRPGRPFRAQGGAGCGASAGTCSKCAGNVRETGGTKVQGMMFTAPPTDCDRTDSTGRTDSCAICLAAGPGHGGNNNQMAVMAGRAVHILAGLSRNSPDADGVAVEVAVVMRWCCCNVAASPPYPVLRPLRISARPGWPQESGFFLRQGHLHGIHLHHACNQQAAV
eukprot:gene25017-biopygen23955